MGSISDTDTISPAVNPLASHQAGITEAFAVLVLCTVVGFRVSRHVRFGVRLLGFVLIFLWISVAGMAAAFYEKIVFNTNLLFLHKRTLSFLITTFSPYLFNVRYEIIEGEEYLTSERPCLFIMNHQSELDLLVLASFIPQETIVLAKDEFKKIPIIGTFMSMVRDIVFLKRQAHTTAIETMNQVGLIVKERNAPVQLFPEGTRTYQTTNDLLPFKKGGFHLAVGGQMPIVIIVAESYHSIYNLKNFWFEGGTIKLKVLPPIPTKGLTTADVGPLAEKCRDEMLKTLVEISQPPPSYAKPLKVPSSNKKHD
ncbi:acyltransferase [Rhizoclosmatium globosum]|uniref:Acyltransferase n=1 Tax=Rhizoclosmatium globosum TaxID=329046 RepID=A0A1Y2BSH6_9FUNG|nr:acyltransferase [Rhizoclosmatium globosum]|eukprot:ORY37700.1 acyltransferase [Rhizoclosmatium globosum]